MTTLNLIITSLSNFLNRMVNGIYPEQSLDNYNKEKRKELNILDEERKINTIIDEQLVKLKEEKLLIIKQKLKNQSSLIHNVSIDKDNESNLTMITKIVYILYNIIKDDTFFNSNKKLYETNKLLYKLEKYIDDLIYTSSFDNEDIILDKLIQLCDYLSLYCPDNSIIKNYINEDISYISLSYIVKTIIEL